MVELLNSNADFTAKYGDAAQYNFVPPQMATFWSFRLMIGLGILSLLFALWGLWATRKGNVPGSKSLST
nr:cytochrome ubiquinol oxidase subunit I [Streptococcus anginosus]